jgi:hypothetical protein
MQGLIDADRDLAVAAVQAGTRAYFAARRDRVPSFVDRHFTLRGTLRLHRVALGWDIARAPLNLSLAAPQMLMKLGAMAAGGLGAKRLARQLQRSILLETAVAREIVWLVNTDLLELPFTEGTGERARTSTRDALAETILATPEVDSLMRNALAEIGRHGEDAEFRDRLTRAMAEYTISRTAAAEITTGLLSLGAGAVALQKVTPGAVSLGPALAGIMAHETAVASFPLGGWLGGVWYSMFPLAPSAGLVAGTTGGLMLGAAVFAAFAGVVSDPVQRALGLHRARLLRMINVLERQVANPQAAGFAVHDHYVARLLDLFDLVGAALRVVRA